jgi:hypothetical protein
MREDRGWVEGMVAQPRTRGCKGENIKHRHELFVLVVKASNIANNKGGMDRHSFLLRLPSCCTSGLLEAEQRLMGEGASRVTWNMRGLTSVDAIKRLGNLEPFMLPLADCCDSLQG